MYFSKNNVFVQNMLCKNKNKYTMQQPRENDTNYFQKFNVTLIRYYI